MLEAEDGASALDLLDKTHVDLVILDLMMHGMSGIDVLAELQARSSDVPVVVVSGNSGIDIAVEAMKHGAIDYIVKPFDVDAISLVVQRVLKEQQQEQALNVLRETEARGFDSIIGQSPALNRALDLARKAMRVDSTVLITGESGTGKDLLARCIHSGGTRASESFIPVSCCAIPQHLVESELFGYEKGAFTGAIEKHIGKVKVADKGILFLDEIGEMPFDAQSKLLRVLQEEHFYPVGSTKMIEVDVRFICATNRDLKTQVEKGKFREDLYYRINVLPIEMPPLRQRREDIAMLVDFFIHKHAQRINANVKRFNPDVLASLASYEWPGNVRELENIVERLLVHHCDATEITTRHLDDIIPAAEKSAQMGLAEFEGLPMDDAVARLERHLILRALKRANNVQSCAAELLGTTRRILKYKMDQLNIETQEQDREISPP